MVQKELVRAEVMEMVMEHQITLKQASEKLRLSYRQTKRIYSRYSEEGNEGLIHRSKGKESNNQKPPGYREKVIKIYKRKYRDLGPTPAAKIMAEKDGVVIDHETLRRWLLAEGLWKHDKRKMHYGKRRERRERFGEMVHLYSSRNDWFNGRRAQCCLMNMVDDATDTTLSIMREHETAKSAMELLWLWIKTYGIPQAVSCGRKNAFIFNKGSAIDQAEEIMPRSPFESACDKLGIEVIVVSKKVRRNIERNHEVFHDRFVKELKRKGITTIEEANHYLKSEYVPGINRMSAVLPKEPEDGHAPLLDESILPGIFCLESCRTVGNDSVFQYEKHLYQIDKNILSRPYPGDKVIVKKWLDGSIHPSWKNEVLLVKEIGINKKKEVCSGRQ